MSLKSIKRFVKKIIRGKSKSQNGYDTLFTEDNFTDKAFSVAEQIRGVNQPPSIIIQGVMPRSGTVYVGELLRLHPDLYAYPNQMWEIPLLQTTGDLIAAQRHFISVYAKNTDRIGKYDFLPLFGASFIKYLSSFVPDNKRMLLKIPNVQYLNFFYKVYPCENIILLMRDGRDLVSSTIRSWPNKDFSEVCQQWKDCADIMLRFKRDHLNSKTGCMYTRYEDILKKPDVFVKDAGTILNLDLNRYPFNEIENISVRGSYTLKKDKNVTWDAMVKPKNFKTTRHWDNWSKSKKDIFKKIAGETLIEAGYAKDSNW